MRDEKTKAGFVAVIGAPNAGKSTLVNHLVGFKVSIVTHKVQTTRTRIRGVCMHGASQIIFVDTPGIFEPKRKLDRAMVDAAWLGADDADLIIFLYDVTRREVDSDTSRILSGLKENNKEAILVLNKIDLVKSVLLLPIIKRFQEENIFSDTFMVSAENGSGCEKLLEYLSVRIPDSPWLYPEDEVSDLPQRLLAAEITREQVLLKLHQELPYGATVETEEWTERDDGAIVINQIIYVKRPGHKKIALGRNGNMIKAIGKASRQELQVLLDRTVHLFLFVKVRENWMEDPDRYSLWGLDPNA